MNTLLVDIGNTRVKWRSFDTLTGQVGEAGIVATGDAGRLADAWHPSVRSPIDHAIVSNVADEAVAAAVERSARATWPDVRVSYVVPGPAFAGLVNGYRRPERLGADRWLALIAARSRYPCRPLLVCNFGTATTIDFLLAGRESDAATFVGGLILPGFTTMRDSLADGTARLAVATGNVVDFANDTSDAIASGLLAAQIGAVRHAVGAARARLDDSEDRGRLACVFAGGAMATMLAGEPAFDIPIHERPDLVLDGLGIFAQAAATDAARETITDRTPCARCS